MQNVQAPPASSVPKSRHRKPYRTWAREREVTKKGTPIRYAPVFYFWARNSLSLHLVVEPNLNSPKKRVENIVQNEGRKYRCFPIPKHIKHILTTEKRGNIRRKFNDYPNQKSDSNRTSESFDMPFWTHQIQNPFPRGHGGPGKGFRGKYDTSGRKKWRRKNEMKSAHAHTAGRKVRQVCLFVVPSPERFVPHELGARSAYLTPLENPLFINVCVFRCLVVLRPISEISTAAVWYTWVAKKDLNWI